MFVSHRVSRNGRIFQFPSLANVSWRFGAHPAGDGISWDDIEAIDADQPHGLDYRSQQHLAKAVRLRIMKEHVEFADDTVGGDHIPGGCQVLLRDTTAHFAAGGDGTCIPNGIACCTAGNQAGLWFFDDNTAATLMQFAPASICKGGDFTWTGGHEFDASVDMSGPVVFHSNVEADATWNFKKSVDFSADVTVSFHGEIDGTHSVMDRVDFSGIGVSGDSTFAGAVEFDSSVDISGTLSVVGDCSSPQFATAWCSFCANGTNAAAATVNDHYNVNAVYKVSTGIYEISFASTLADGNYVVAGMANKNNSGIAHRVGIFCVSTATDSCRIECRDFGDAASAIIDSTRIYIVVFGGN